MFPRRSKYNSVKTSYNGRRYDSKKEAEHAATLDMMRKAVAPAQKVVDVVPQYNMPLIVNGVKVGVYRADFFVTFADGHTEVQDVKSAFTAKMPLYRMKKKLVRALYNLDIVEI